MSFHVILGAALCGVALAAAVVKEGNELDAPECDPSIRSESRERPKKRHGLPEEQLESPLGRRADREDQSLATRWKNRLRVSVVGHVRSPGTISCLDGLSLRQAIENSGGATEFGSMRRVRLCRGGRQLKFDLLDSSIESILIEPGDTVEVPQKMVFGR